MPINRYFKLYLNAGRALPLVINVNQYDSGETWYFRLFKETGEAYLPSSGAIVGVKADGHVIDNAATVDGFGYVVVTETEQMTAAAGEAVFEISIDDNSHGTANFIVLVEPKPSDGGILSESDLSLIQDAIDSTSPAAIAQGVSDWMDENLTPTTPVVDSSLTVQGAAADAKKTGDEIADLRSAIEQGGSLTSAIKSALLQIAQKVAYIDDDGQTYYDDLYDALYPPIVVTAITLNTNSLSFGTLNATQQLTATTTPSGGAVTWSSSDTSVATVSQTGVVTSVAYGNATITATSGSVSATCSVAITQATLSSISAVYTQSGTVYDTDSLDSLKSDLVVTATWSDSSTSTVASADYTLSGTLTVGTSTITVTYGGKTDTFDVTVSRDPSTLVNTVTGVTPLISIGDITLTSGMINDSDEIVAQSNSYVYNEFVPGNAWITLNSSYALKDINHRTAGYDSSKSFLGRNYKNGGGFYDGASFVKMGYTGSVDSTCYLLNLPYLLSNICTIEGVRISNTGEEQTESGYYSSDFIPIQTTGVGALSSISGTSKVTGIAFYDSSKTFISYAQATSISTNKNFVAPFEITSNMKYCRITTAYPAKSAISLVIEEV